MTQKSAVAARTPKKKASSWQKRDWFAAYVFIAPVTIGLLIFYIWPFFQNIWFSFNDVNKFNMTTFVGLDNFVKMFSDNELWSALGNSLKYVVITVPVGLFLQRFVESLFTVRCISCLLLPCLQQWQWYGNGSTMSRWVF